MGGHHFYPLRGIFSSEMAPTDQILWDESQSPEIVYFLFHWTIFQ